MTPKQIRGYREQLVEAIRSCNDATVELDIATAKKLVDVLDRLSAEVHRLTRDRNRFRDEANKFRLALRKR